MATQESGITSLELAGGRIGSWRRSHAARGVHHYQVVSDGSVVAEFEARVSQTVTDEIAAALWEVAQDLGRATTCDVVAIAASGDELARKVLRVQPARAAAEPTADLGRVVAVLLDHQRDMTRLVSELVGAVASQLSAIGSASAALVTASAARAESAERISSATQDSLDRALAAADAVEPRSDSRAKIERILFGLLAKNLGPDADPPEPPGVQ